MELRTNRLTLKQWSEDLRDPFAQMNMDSEVMADLGGPYDRANSDRKFDRYCKAYNMDGLSRWALIDLEGQFVGYAGVIKNDDLSHSLGEHWDIGWQLRREMWGRGYATEASIAALEDAFDRCGIARVLSYTDPKNMRSQAVMTRVGLTRNESLDFTHDYGSGMIWSGLVWCATASP